MEDKIQEPAQASVKDRLRNVMNDLLVLRAYVDGIEALSQNMPDKAGGAIQVLALEGSKVCAKVHTEVDYAEMNIGKNKGLEA